jgi:hypothetical protein
VAALPRCRMERPGDSRYLSGDRYRNYISRVAAWGVQLDDSYDFLDEKYRQIFRGGKRRDAARYLAWDGHLPGSPAMTGPRRPGLSMNTVTATAAAFLVLCLTGAIYLRSPYSWRTARSPARFSASPSTLGARSPADVVHLTLFSGKYKPDYSFTAFLPDSTIRV